MRPEKVETSGLVATKGPREASGRAESQRHGPAAYVVASQGPGLHTHTHTRTHEHVVTFLFCESLLVSFGMKQVRILRVYSF